MLQQIAVGVVSVLAFLPWFRLWLLLFWRCLSMSSLSQQALNFSSANSKLACPLVIPIPTEAGLVVLWGGICMVDGISRYNYPSALSERATHSVWVPFNFCFSMVLLAAWVGSLWLCMEGEIIRWSITVWGPLELERWSMTWWRVKLSCLVLCLASNLPVCVQRSTPVWWRQAEFRNTLRVETSKA